MIYASIQIAGLVLAVVATAAMFGLWAAALAAGLAATVVAAGLEAGDK
jgi:hypothetical protein